MGSTESVLLAGILKETKELRKEQVETNRLLRILAGEPPPQRRY